MTTHSFAEIVNQCATLERLLDTLGWAEAYEPLRGATVLVCNPTTSSAVRPAAGAVTVDDHDLVLASQDGTRYRFEISDIASDQDGNGKERKDLVTLGVLARDGSTTASWPNGRQFLVVSSEFAGRLRRPTRHGLARNELHYDELKADGQTRIFEVRLGPRTR